MADKKGWDNKITSSLATAGGAVMAALLFGGGLFALWKNLDDLQLSGPLVVTAIGLSFVLLGGAVSWLEGRAARTEVEPIRKEREEIRDRIRLKQPDIFDTVQLNLNQLEEYYT